MVYVATAGMISAIGNSVPECWNSILLQKDGITKPEVLQTLHTELSVGEIKLSNDSLRSALNADSAGMSRTALLGIYAMREALQWIPKEKYQSADVAFINATSVGGMSDVENMYDQMIAPAASDEVISYIDSLDCADCTMRIADYFGFKGFQATISTACSSSANAILMGARMIEQGEVSMAICGGTDALTRFTLNGFNALKNVDKDPSCPFDQHRNGLNLGEAAAYCVLVSQDLLSTLQIIPEAIFAGYGNTNEAHHPTAPSPDGKGALLTMQTALQNAGLQPGDINYINAHGTATLGNDLSEGNAIKDLFGEAVPFSSTKAFTGHTLAAAGAVEAILTCKALQQNTMPPNLRFSTPMEETGLSPLPQLDNSHELRYAISSSFAFGGNNVALIFEKFRR